MDEDRLMLGPRPPVHAVDGVRFMVPWRSDGEERDRLRTFTRAWWAAACPWIETVEGPSPDGPFNRSAAINNAARGDWDVGIVLDADVVASGEQVHAAVERTRQTGRVTLAYTIFLGLTPHATAEVLAGRMEFERRSYRFMTDVHESSIVVVPRSLWDEVGGFDERFVGWGQEDVAFVQAARILGGPVERVDGNVLHLWHPRAPDRIEFSPQWRMNQKLGQRYRAVDDPVAMRALLDERGADERARISV